MADRTNVPTWVINTIFAAILGQFFVSIGSLWKGSLTYTSFMASTAEKFKSQDEHFARIEKRDDGQDSQIERLWESNRNIQRRPADGKEVQQHETASVRAWNPRDKD